MSDFSIVVNSIFNNKKLYNNIDDNEKEKFFFIFNRYMARAHPYNAEALNKNGIDTLLALDIWNRFSEKTTQIPKWFYPSIKKKELSDNSNIDKLILQYYPEELIVKEEEKNNILKKIKNK